MVHVDEPGIRTVQIAGSDPVEMADAARINVESGAQIIDINMGCPAKKVNRKLAGSALLQYPDLVKSILTEVVNAVDVPVTLKIRTGWAPEHR
ncbi:tRNA dihydrouridine synthase DusB, partial [Citrobacter freundii]